MLQRLYVHNFRCLENFELDIRNMSSALLIGKNGSGKSTVGSVFEILQSVAAGLNRVSNLINLNDFACGRNNVPIRFEIEVILEEKPYQYIIAFDLPEKFAELQVSEEKLLVSGNLIFSRQKAQVTLHRDSQKPEAKFLLDWHLVALPIIQHQSTTDPIYIFKTWLSQIIILTPIPGLINGESKSETLKPNRDGSNFADWFLGLLSRYPATYTSIDKYLRTVMPDIRDFKNEQIGRDFKIMTVRFNENHAEMSVYFEDLSDGEKCFFICAAVLAANESYGPVFCFWDEPDNYLSLSEVGHFVTSLRRSFGTCGQFLATTHNSEAIRKFSNENTLVLYRKNHLEPTLLKLLSDVSFKGDLIDALIRGDIEL